MHLTILKCIMFLFSTVIHIVLTQPANKNWKPGEIIGTLYISTCFSDLILERRNMTILANN